MIFVFRIKLNFPFNRAFLVLLKQKIKVSELEATKEVYYLEHQILTTNCCRRINLLRLIQTKIYLVIRRMKKLNQALNPHQPKKLSKVRKQNNSILKWWQLSINLAISLKILWCAHVRKSKWHTYAALKAAHTIVNSGYTARNAWHKGRGIIISLCDTF